MATELATEILLRVMAAASVVVASVVVLSSLVGSPPRAPPRWRPRAASRAGVGVRMGISDRTATDGQLYDGWGKEGMRVLNKTATFQQVTDESELSHYDAVLMVAARAKQNAYENAEEPSTGYIGNSFGGAMGAGMRKKKPAKSEVVHAIEQLLEEFEETQELPELITPGIPQDLLDSWEQEAAAEAAALAEAAANASAAAEGEGLLDDSSLQALGLTEGAAADVVDDDDDHDDDTEAGEAGEADESDDDDVLASLLGADDFDDDLAIDEEFGDEDDEAAVADDDLADDDLADLFGEVAVSADGAVEASGMSPGDGG